MGIPKVRAKRSIGPCLSIPLISQAIPSCVVMTDGGAVLMRRRSVIG